MSKSATSVTDLGDIHKSTKDVDLAVSPMIAKRDDKKGSRSRKHRRRRHRKLALKILIIDDDEADCLAIRRVLAAERINVDLRIWTDVELARGVSAEQAASHDWTPDLVLLDLNLGEASGFDLLSGFKSLDATKSIPVIIFTTSSDRRDVERSYELGANSYVVKPPTLAEFGHFVRALNSYWTETAVLPNHARAAPAEDAQSLGKRPSNVGFAAH